MHWPGTPSVERAMDTMLLPTGKRRLTSSISSAPAVMISQHRIKKTIEYDIPEAAVATGRASIPPPIEVPTINKIPPINFELGTTHPLYKNKTL